MSNGRMYMCYSLFDPEVGQSKALIFERSMNQGAGKFAQCHWQEDQTEVLDVES